jgi:hypothetical protein
MSRKRQGGRGATTEGRRQVALYVRSCASVAVVALSLTLALTHGSATGREKAESAHTAAPAVPCLAAAREAGWVLRA